jgi:hypothetical protein
MICPLRSWSKPMIERSERLPAGKLVLLLRELVHPEPSEVNRGAGLFLVPFQDLDMLPSYSASFTLYINLYRCAIASIDKMLFLNQCNIVSICIDTILHQLKQGDGVSTCVDARSPRSIRYCIDSIPYRIDRNNIVSMRYHIDACRIASIETISYRCDISLDISSLDRY